MNTDRPYVVLVCGLSAGVGRTTLASNLAVYLKALQEDLPVAYLPLEASADPAAMFSLGRTAEHSLADFRQADCLSALLRFGQFGVDYCEPLPPGTASPQPGSLRRFLAESNYPGIVLLAGGLKNPYRQAAIEAADLLLVIGHDPASLAELNGLRRQLRVSGGSDRQLCLLPSQLGKLGNPQPQVEAEALLRFAADERDIQVLTEVLPLETQVAEQVGAGRSVLTRAAESCSHQQLRQLAELLLSRWQSDECFPARLRRSIEDQSLPRRAARIHFYCPHCDQPVWGQPAHYLESFPARRRLLVHRPCLERLLKEQGLDVFGTSWELLLLQPAAAQGGEQGQFRLQLFTAGGERLEGVDFPLNSGSGWDKLLNKSTGRHPLELYGESILLGAAQPAATLLSKDWYRGFQAQKRQLRQRCAHELC